MIRLGEIRDAGVLGNAVMRHVGRRLTWDPDDAEILYCAALSERHLYLLAAIERAGAVCPLTPDEITDWERKLRRRADSEIRLQDLVTYWYYIASSFLEVPSAAEQERVRQYRWFRLEQGDLPRTVELPDDFHRIDRWLPDIASRLTAIHTELLGLPEAVKTRLGVCFSDYGEAMDSLAALPGMLKTVADAWDRPHRGQPSLKSLSYAVGLLVCAVEDYTGERFPSPRSVKRQAEINLVRLLAAKLFPARTPENIETMLGHFHADRLNSAKRKPKRAPRKGKRLNALVI